MTQANEYKTAPSEIWVPVTKDIPKYFLGMYEVSDLGRVRRTKNWTICPPQQASYNYTYNELIKCGIRLRLQTMRMVALHFIPNPNNYRCVLKVIKDKWNNRVDNLKWGTIGDSHVMYRKEKFKIMQFTMSGAYVNEYDSLGTASIESGAHKQGISNCYNDRKNVKSAGGFTWKKVYYE